MNTGDIAGARIAFGAVSTASTLWIPSRISLSDALLAEGRASAAVAVLDDVMDGDLEGSELSEVRLKMVSALRAAGENDRAVSLARLVFMKASENESVSAAERLLVALGRPVSMLQKTIRMISRGDRGELRSVNSRAVRSPSTLAHLDPALPAVVKAAYVLDAGRDPAIAIKLLEEARAVVVDPDLASWIEMVTGDALVEEGNDTAAAEAYGRVVERYPFGPFATQAGFLGARAFMRSGAHDRAIALLRVVRDTTPSSGGANTARWERALAALMVGKYDEALIALDELIAAVDRGDGLLFGIAERARYFRGVSLFLLGDPESAFVDLNRVARGAEYSWYGILARSRLESWNHEAFRASAVLAEDAGKLKGAVPAGGGNVDELDAGVRFRFSVNDRAVGPVLLYKMGETQAGISELAARAHRGLLNEEGLRLLAVMKARGAAPRKAMRAATWLRGAYVPDTGWIHTGAYPRPFSGEVDQASSLFDLDPALIYGVMRAESGFNPGARSPVGAAGLMQLMRQTAKAVAGKLLAPAGLSASLWKPAGNILLGSALLDQLVRHFDGHLPLVLTGYNAGSGAARRIWKKLKHLPTDVFVEAIPYGATRDYVRKVVGFAAAYRYLYGNSIPLRVSMTVPAKLGPWIFKPSVSSEEPSSQ
jgi:soluble lytic murein transglycosylase-like protein